ncbi:SH3 domain-containing protein [Pseudorhodobacter sp.]|uniref:SH3 domain-containing protein n=1 Tax=Pseudorhodobacter sp. TaxID=1934400 RepID=UPI0026495F69|nr:SH3 domain-containing protein [Pseudorhodobacter sp.]MDN5785940.1 SH3 domain-containing protein [Pseudorhodobacter sp.]
MIKLLVLLGAVMFVTLLIGGEDNGQMRQGLAANDTPTAPPAARPAPAKTAKAVTLASFTPVTVQPQAPATPRVFVVTQTAAATAAADVAPTSVENNTDDFPVMYVSSRSVNVRQGPSTNEAIVERLSRAEAVSVVSAEVDGWVQVRIEGDGVEGYIAARLLTDVNPSN